jgi:two-component system NtrC family response regulator
MAYSVLILDDDADFNSLLTDIFEQADYEVTSLEDPVEAVDVFRNTHFDLVVTDHKMPGMTGAEYMKAIKQMRPEVPVIIVSGYLENDTIRELISDGVGGVFLKPLNIFSLLERTAELLEEAQKIKNDGGQGVGAGPIQGEAKLSFNFRSFPCKDPKSIHFAEQLHRLRNFKSNLSLIGESGSNYRGICNDIQGFYESEGEHFIYLSPESFDEVSTLTLVLKAQDEGSERVTCVLLGVELMNPTQRKLAIMLARAEGPFEINAFGLRTIFCLSGDLDELFDDGDIDEDLYILMGTAEVRVPSMNECTLDIGVIAQQQVVQLVSVLKLRVVPIIDKAAIKFLEVQSWDGDFIQLKSVVHAAVIASAREIIGADAMQRAYESISTASARGRALSYLLDQKTDYARAVLTLFNGDSAKAAHFFGAESSAFESVLK